MKQEPYGLLFLMHQIEKMAPYMNKISFYMAGNIEIVIGTGMHEFPYHTHNSFMVGAIMNGSGEFCIGDENSKLYKEDIYVVPSNTGISIKPVNDFSYITICLKNDLADRMTEYEVNEYYYIGLGDVLFEFANTFQMERIDEKDFVNKIIGLLGLKKVPDSKVVRSEAIINAVQYIQSCEDRFDLNEISKLVYLSKYHFIRLFKKDMGITPKQYHQQCRIRNVKRMALHSLQKEIAYDLGFSTQSHMDSVFKQYMGITLNNYIDSIVKK